MKYSIFAIVLSFLLFQSVSVAAHDDDGHDWEDNNVTSWDDFEILDEFIAENETSMDNSTLYELDADLADCEYKADNHGHFVKCCKKALKNYRDAMDEDEFKALKKAIAQSDFGKSAIELLVEDTGVKFNKNEVKLLDKCQKSAKSLDAYKKCLNKTLKALVKQGGLNKKEFKKIKKSVADNDEIEQEVEDEIEKEND